MKKLVLLLAGLLTLSTLIFAGTKSYSLTLGASAKVAGVELARGTYTLQVEGDKAVFTDANRKAVSVPAKMATGTGKKYEFTSVESVEKNGAPVIQSIHLAGSTTTLEFGD